MKKYSLLMVMAAVLAILIAPVGVLAMPGSAPTVEKGNQVILAQDFTALMNDVYVPVQKARDAAPRDVQTAISGDYIALTNAIARAQAAQKAGNRAEFNAASASARSLKTTLCATLRC